MYQVSCLHHFSIKSYRGWLNPFRCPFSFTVYTILWILYVNDFIKFTNIYHNLPVPYYDFHLDNMTHRIIRRSRRGIKLVFSAFLKLQVFVLKTMYTHWDIEILPANYCKLTNFFGILKYFHKIIYKYIFYESNQIVLSLNSDQFYLNIKYLARSWIK